MGEYHRANCTSPGVILLSSNKYKTKNLGVLNTCSLVNRVILIDAGSLVENRGSDTIVLEAGASIRGNTVHNYFAGTKHYSLHTTFV